MEEVPFEDRYVPKAEIDWDRSLWWWYPVTRALHPASRLLALVVGALAVLILQFGLEIANWIFAPRFHDQVQRFDVPWLGHIRLAPIELGQSMLFETLGLRELAYLTFCALWISLVGGLVGGILVRRAAIELGQRTIAPWGETLQVVMGRALSYLWVTGMHLVSIAVILIFPLLLGLISRVGPLSWLGGILLILLFPLSFVVGRLVVSMFWCYPLAVAAISCERNADAFEGFSRSNNYFFQRPVVAVACSLLLIAVGYIGFTLVYWLFLAGWHWFRDAYLAGAGLSVGDLIAKPVDGDKVKATAGNVVRWVSIGGWITRLVMAGFWFSYFWAATAALYLILRRCIDNTDLDDIDSPYAGAAVNLPELPTPPTPAAAPSATPSAE